MLPSALEEDSRSVRHRHRRSWDCRMRRNRQHTSAHLDPTLNPVGDEYLVLKAGIKRGTRIDEDRREGRADRRAGRRRWG